MLFHFNLSPAMYDAYFQRTQKSQTRENVIPTADRLLNHNLSFKRQFIDGASKNTENDVSRCPEKHFVLRSTPQGNMSLGRRGHKNQVHLDSQRFTGDSQPCNSSWKCQHKNKTGKKIFAFQGYLTNTEIQ